MLSSPAVVSCVRQSEDDDDDDDAAAGDLVVARQTGDVHATSTRTSRLLYSSSMYSSEAGSQLLSERAVRRPQHGGSAYILHTHSRTHTQPFNGPLSGTTRVSRYQKGKTNLDFTEAIDSEWHWHQLGHMQVCTSLQTDNHASAPPLCFLQARCPSCRPTNSVKALKAGLYILVNKPLATRLAIVAIKMAAGK